MNAKKTLTGIVLSAYLAIASPLAFSQNKPEHKFRFSLSRYETPYFKHLQEHRKAFGRNYRIFKAPGDNMPIIVPDASKYPMHIIKPGPEWYGDDKFVIKPGPEWMLPRSWMRKELYKNPAGKLPLGALLYHWEHK